LAHIRRHDALINLMQMLVESLLFFNPAVWWLSRQIRIEREACCDALAATVCGPPLAVARTLVEVAASLRENAAEPALPLTLAIADPAREGELTDRVQRLVHPERAATPKLSWIGLATVGLAVLVAAAALQQATDFAVRAAAQLMSPNDRIERLARLHAEANAVFLPAANRPAGAPENEPAFGPDDPSIAKLKVTLIIRTEDGSLLPTKMQIVSESLTGHYGKGESIAGPHKEVPEYRKALTFPPCKLRVGTSAPGFAFAASPVVTIHPDDPERTIEIVLKRGSKATLKIVDEQKKPIAGAELRTTACLSHGSGTAYFDQSKFVCNAD
jgi:hypothetical protein